MFAECLSSADKTIAAIPASIKITAISILSLFLFFSFITIVPSYKQQYHLSNTTPSPLRPPGPVVQRTGIIDDNGTMTADFIVGEYDEKLFDIAMFNATKEIVDEENRKVHLKELKNKNYRVCDMSMSDHIPCSDNVEAIKTLKSLDRGEKNERHCPEKGNGLYCIVPRPKGYKRHISWPLSRDEVLFDNVPQTQLGDMKWVARKKEKLVFPSNGVEEYLDQISKMVPEIAFGKRSRVALDINSGVASFGAYLMKRNVTTLSIAPKDVNQNQIQIALERGVPAIVAAFATHRLLFPSQAFDLVHCSNCEIDWIRDDGILLLEVNRILRGGGYFVYKQETFLVEQRKQMENVARSICWELVKRDGYIAIWKKPEDNSCNLSSNRICDNDDNPDYVWYVHLKNCIKDGYGANVTAWPQRLYDPPDRLLSIEMDASESRNDIYKAETMFWQDVVGSYIQVFKLEKLNIRNVMNMKAGYGGFAAAIHHYQLDYWVMNVVPVSGVNTLPVIYDRGLIGVLHDWCEPFDTYPRTYDLLNAVDLFSAEKKRCNISTIILEMDRILRPDGQVFIRETRANIDELMEIAQAVGWVTHLFNSYEGPHSKWRLLYCEKRIS